MTEKMVADERASGTEKLADCGMGYVAIAERYFHDCYAGRNMHIVSGMQS